MYTSTPPEWECIHPKEMLTGPSSRRNAAIVTHQGILFPPPPHYPHRDVFYVLTLCSSSLARADVILVRRLGTPPPAIDTTVQQSSDPFRYATVYCMIPSRGLAVVEVPVHGNDGSSVPPRRHPFSSLVTVVVPPRAQLIASVGDTAHVSYVRSVVEDHEPTTQLYTLSLSNKHESLQPGTPWYMKQRHEPPGSAVHIATPVALATFGHGFSDAAVPLQWDDALFHRMFGCACLTNLNHQDRVWRRDACGECGHRTTPPRHDSTRTLASWVFLPRVDTSFPFLIIMGIVFSPLLRNHATHPVAAEAYAHMCNGTKRTRTQCIIVTHVTKCTQKEVRRYSVSSCLEAGTVVTHVNHRPVTSLDGVMAAFHSPVTSERDGALLMTFRTVLGSTFVISVADALSIEHACCQSLSDGYRSVRSLELVKVLEQFRRPDQGMPPPLPLASTT